MKICTVDIQTQFGKVKRLGALVDNNTVVDLQNVLRLKYEKEGRFNPKERAARKLPSSLHAVLNLLDSPINELNDVLSLHSEFKKQGDLFLKDQSAIQYTLNEEIKLACPLDKITTYRDFYAHEKHVAAGFKKRQEPIPEAWYQIPAYYKGATEGFIGPDEEILWPHYTDILDYELEMGMVVGKEGKNIKSNKACDHIFGFTILNDISARDIQRKEMAIRLGPAKGKDFCSIMGPVITTIDEFNGTEPDLLMTAKINGEEWSRGQSGDSHFSFAQMIEHVSMDEWVLPGDFFGSGTVGTGCGLELDKWIQPGDELELTVESIGTLKNTVGNKSKGE